MFRKHALLRFSVLISLTLSNTSQAATAHEQAIQNGIRTCLPAIEKVETYLAGRQASDAVIFWDAAAADRNMFSALITLEGTETNNIASLNVVPSADGQCVAEYTQTGYVDQNCVNYLKTLGNQLRFVRDMGKKSALFQGQGVQILLTNAGKGCVWVRKEIIKLPQASVAQEVSQPSSKSKSAQPKRSR